ncbi:MAG: EscU/YscU/HrcU family type III secretion system export apparatus switch protein [Verrucomicrobiota bacterium]
MSNDGNKTEEPTAKKLEEAHAEGNIARAPDLQLVAVLAAFLWSLSVLGPGICAEIASVSVGIFAHLGKTEIRPEAAAPWAYESLKVLVMLALPFSFACAFAGGLMGAVQTRFRFTPKVLSIKVERLDPAAGFQRVFSLNGLVKVGFEALRLLVVAWVIYGGLSKILGDPIFNTPVPLNRLGEFLVESTKALLWRCILALGIIAAGNYLYQLNRIHKSLMMSRQEVTDESKQSEGDPKVKNALRAMARRLLQRQMLKSLETADVIVTNPTHFAVALRYDRDKEAAPMIVAKGEQAFARRIKAIALEKGVPMVENPPVARMLYKFGKVGKPIPVNLYKAVAEILAFVYQAHRSYFRELKNRRAES